MSTIARPPSLAGAAPPAYSGPSRRARIAVSLVAGASLGSVAALLLPRGPLTPGAAIALLVVTLAGGVAIGRWTRSRAAIALAPVGYAVAFELLGDHAGMTAGTVSLGTSWGILAALAGRLLHGAVALLPLAVGAALGAALARRGTPARPGPLAALARGLRTAALAGGLLLLGVVLWQLATPASTPSLDPVPGKHAVAELRSVHVGGAKLWLSIRGRDDGAPVVLYLPGGPGQSDLGLGRALLEPLTDDFVVAVLDGRGIGKAYPSFDEASMRTDRLVDDIVAVTDLLRRRFHQDRIFLVGESGGTVLGVQAIQRAPARFAAWFGSGQMVDPLETDQRIRAQLVRHLRADGDTAALARLERFGRPPYASPEANAWIMGYYDRLAGDYDPPAAYVRRGEEAGVGFLGLGAPEYGLTDKVGAVRGLMDGFATVYPQWQRIDFRRTVRELPVPVHLFTGRHELAGRRTLALEWFSDLDAPRKALHEFADAGHAAAFEHVEALHAALRAEVARGAAD